MDLAIEFQKIKEGQELILQLLNQATVAKKEALKVYTLDELADVFSVTKRTIYNWKEEGRLAFVCIGSKTYVTQAQLDEFLQANEVKPFKGGRN